MNFPSCFGDEFIGQERDERVSWRLEVTMYRADELRERLSRRGLARRRIRTAWFRFIRGSRSRFGIDRHFGIDFRRDDCRMTVGNRLGAPFNARIYS